VRRRRARCSIVAAARRGATLPRRPSRRGPALPPVAALILAVPRESSTSPAAVPLRQSLVISAADREGLPLSAVHPVRPPVVDREGSSRRGPSPILSARRGPVRRPSRLLLALRIGALQDSSRVILDLRPNLPRLIFRPPVVDAVVASSV